MPLSECIEACEQAHRACTESVIHGLQHGGEAAEWELIQLLLDCADINETAADFMLRSSRRHHLTCHVAAEVSDLCANACERLSREDVRLKECAQTCRRAATACRKVLKN